MTNLFERKTCFVITGASRGLGKCIAVNFAKKANQESAFLLLSRNTNALKTVETEIKSCCPNLKIATCEFDQGNLDENKTGKIFESIFTDKNLSLDNYEQAVIVHNAGTLGDNSKFVKDLNSAEELNSYFAINLTGVVLLNAAFMKFFTEEKCTSRFVINISSLTAIQAFKNFALYCTGEKNIKHVPQ